MMESCDSRSSLVLLRVEEILGERLAARDEPGEVELRLEPHRAAVAAALVGLEHR